MFHSAREFPEGWSCRTCMPWHQRVSFLYLTEPEEAQGPQMSRFLLQVERQKGRRHHGRCMEMSNMPRLLLQTSRREGCPGESVHTQHSAFNFLPWRQSPAASPVTAWPDWRHCFLEQFSQTCRFFRFPLPCYAQVLPNPIKICPILALWEGSKGGIWSLVISCSRQDSSGSPLLRHCSKLWCLPMMSGCWEGIGLHRTSYHTRGSFWGLWLYSDEAGELTRSSH